MFVYKCSTMYYMVPQKRLLTTGVHNVTSSATLDNWQDLSEVPTWQHAHPSYWLILTCQVSECAIQGFKCKLVCHGCLIHYNCLTFLYYPTKCSAFFILHMGMSIAYKSNGILNVSCNVRLPVNNIEATYPARCNGQ